MSSVPDPENTPKPTPPKHRHSTDQLAHELIALVQERGAPRATLLQHRIDKVLAYMEEVVTPNAITLRHIRRHLDGTYDSFPPRIPRPADIPVSPDQESAL